MSHSIKKYGSHIALGIFGITTAIITIFARPALAAAKCSDPSSGTCKQEKACTDIGTKSDPTGCRKVASGPSAGGCQCVYTNSAS